MRKLLLLFVFSLMLFPALAETPAKAQGPLSEDRWEELSEDLDYQEKEPEKKDRNWPNLPNFSLDGQVIKYAFFFIVLGVFIYFVTVSWMWMKIVGIVTKSRHCNISIL